MNCACVYSSFGRNEEGVQFLTQMIQKFTPQNSSEESVWNMLNKKLVELERHRVEEIQLAKRQRIR